MRRNAITGVNTSFGRVECVEEVKSEAKGLFKEIFVEISLTRLVMKV